MKKLSDINESVWGNISKRADGTMERKEDNVDNLSKKDLYDYLNSIYKTIGHVIYYGEFNDGTQSIEIPLFEKGRHTFYLIYSTNQDCISFADLSDFTPNLYKNLHKKFNACVVENNYGKHVIIKSEKLTNRFVISIVDFIIENPPVNADMCIERKMNESVWGNISKRADGTMERKEDLVGNLKLLKPIDIGCSVLWADQDLEINSNYFFKFDEIQELIKNSGWRLPTIKDVDNLHRHCTHKKYNNYFLECGKNSIMFNRNGMIYNTSVSHGNEIVTYRSEYWGWTSEETGDGSTIHCFIITDNDILYTPLGTRSFGDYIDTDRTAKLCVRLIKDK